MINLTKNKNKKNEGLMYKSSIVGRAVVLNITTAVMIFGRRPHHTSEDIRYNSTPSRVILGLTAEKNVKLFRIH